MIDLTGANLINYLLRMIRDIVERNPRWKHSLGEVTFPANTIIKWGDVWISITSVTTSGNRLSPAYFMCTQIGRAILAKVGDKDGQFIEWTREVDPTNQNPTSGVYYMNVDFFDDRTRDLGLTVHKYRWQEGNLKEAVGTIVNFRPGIDLNTVNFTDGATSTPVQATVFNQSTGGFAYLITPTQQLKAQYNGDLASSAFPAWNPSVVYQYGQVVFYNGGTWFADAPVAPPVSGAPTFDPTMSWLSGTIVNFNGVPYTAIANVPIETPQVPTTPPNATFWAPYRPVPAGVAPSTGAPYWTSYVSPVPLAGTSLTPLTDFWYQRPQSAVIVQKTRGGTELANIPSPFISVSLTDQDGYVLRQGIDYTFQGPQWIVLSQFTPPGSTITANMVVKLNPANEIGIMSENYLQVNLAPGETLAPNQVFINTPAGSFTNPAPQPDGSLLIPQLLQPGDYLRWEVRIDAGQVKAKAKKWEITNLPQVDPNTIKYGRYDAEGQLTQTLTAAQVAAGDPSSLQGVIQISAGDPLLVNGQQVPILPGLRLAIGDSVVVGDQAAILVSPNLTETYEVFGSKENLSFTLEIKANDLQTSSDLAEMIKRELLIMRRINTEADGLTIFEANRSFVGEARDTSATAPRYVNNVTVSAAADWKVYVPLVTRVTNFEIVETLGQTDFLGKLQMAPRMTALGTSRFSDEIFIPSYR